MCPSSLAFCSGRGISSPEIEENRDSVGVKNVVIVGWQAFSPLNAVQPRRRRSKVSPCRKYSRSGVGPVTSLLGIEPNKPPHPLLSILPMASKPPAVSPGNEGSVALAQHPPSIDLSNKLLSSAIPLPRNASVVYAAFSPTTSTALPADTVELARRRIIDIGKPSLLDSILCTVYVEKGTQQLYVFSIVSSDGSNDPFNSLRSLHFDGLICESSFRSTILFSFCVF